MFAWKIWNAICGTWKRDFNTRHTIVMNERGGWKLLISTMCEHLTQFSFWFLFIFWCDVTSHNGMRVNKKYILCLDEGKIIRDMNIETYNVYWCSLGVEHKFIKNHMMINCLCTNLERYLTAFYLFCTDYVLSIWLRVPALSSSAGGVKKLKHRIYLVIYGV